jgi:predicted enzyme related to lactoylglutathione lyase
MLMAINARYVHTNLVARDWKKLAHFYETVLDCAPVLPERDLSGQPLDAATGLQSAHIRGIHLRLPGGGATGPTLEIFQYDQLDDRGTASINSPGYAHLAFVVDDVEETRRAVFAAGGGNVGSVVAHEVAGVGTIKFAYLTDPEGNIIEVQEAKG